MSRNINRIQAISDLFLSSFTNIVVTISVLLASVSEAFRSRDVEFMTNVLLENQVPICQSTEERPVLGSRHPG